MFGRAEAILELTKWSRDRPRLKAADWRKRGSGDKVGGRRLPAHELRLAIPYPTSPTNEITVNSQLSWSRTVCQRRGHLLSAA